MIQSFRLSVTICCLVLEDPCVAGFFRNIVAAIFRDILRYSPIFSDILQYWPIFDIAPPCTTPYLRAAQLQGRAAGVLVGSCAGSPATP